MFQGNNNFFAKNRNEICHRLKNNSIVIIESNILYPKSGDQYFPFNQESNFYYLTGINYPDTKLVLIISENNQYEEILFIPETDKKKVVWEGEGLNPKKANEISGIQKIKFLDEWGNIITNKIQSFEIIYLDYEENLPAFFQYKNQLLENIKTQFPDANIVNLQPYLKDLRLIKKDVEIEMIRKAVQITYQSFFDIVPLIKAGAKEYDIEATLDLKFKIQNAEHAFYPIVAGGKNACTLHYTSNRDELRNNELVLIDFGASFNHYCSDCTRVLPVNGKFSKRQKEIYNKVLDIFKKAKELLLPGTTITSVNNEVEKWMKQSHIELGLYSENDYKNDNGLMKKYFPHSIGHFMGLDVHDVGDKDTMLKPGMILTCEPGIYIPEEGVGIRLENDILITDNGNDDLMEKYPIEIVEIEQLMREFI